MRIKSKGEKVFSVVNYALLALLGVAFVLPYVLILVMSFTSTDSYYHKGYSLFPESLTLEGYRMIFGRGSEIYTAFYNTLLITFLGTLIGLVCTAPVAYALSRKRLFGRRFFNGLIVFAMLFSGGLIPSFLLLASLNMLNPIGRSSCRGLWCRGTVSSYARILCPFPIPLRNPPSWTAQTT